MTIFGVVYVHTNKINGKSYVGQTCQELSRRFRKDDAAYNGYRSCTAFQRALKKYTWESFETTILVSCKSQEDLDFMEEYFIRLYNSTVPNGYNSVGFAMGKVVYTKEVKAKIAKATGDRMRGAPLPEGMKLRKEHRIVDGEPLKECSDCKKELSLTAFCANTLTWDKLGRICKSCAHARRAVKTDKLPPLSVSDVPDLNRPIFAVTKSNKVVEYSSALKAGKYNPSGILNAIRTKVEYRGRHWYFA